MRKVVVGVFFLFSLVAFSEQRERFYIAEEMFLSGEYVKSIGIYRTLEPYRLLNYEKELLYYRLSFMTNIGDAILILSNSTLDKSRELQSFLISYLGYRSTNVCDIVNTKDEIEVYNILDSVKFTDNVDVNFSLILYFSLSNLKVKVDFLVTNDFDLLKMNFVNAIVFRNLGNFDESQRIVNDIFSRYPDSFWAKVLRKYFVTNYVKIEDRVDNVNLEEGYYFVVDDAGGVIRQSLMLKNYKVKFLGHYNTPEEARQAYLNAKQKYHVI